MPFNRARERKVVTGAAMMIMTVLSRVRNTLLRRNIGLMRGEVRRKNDMFRPNDRFITKEDHCANGMIELAQIPRPRVNQQLLHGLGMYGGDLFSRVRRASLEFGCDQGGQFLHPFAQSGNEKREPIEPVE